MLVLPAAFKAGDPGRGGVEQNLFLPDGKSCIFCELRFTRFVTLGWLAKRLNCSLAAVFCVSQSSEVNLWKTVMLRPLKLLLH
jgi:hypothetical protein